MASKATQIFDLPEHPIEQVVREAVTSKGKRLQEWGEESVLVREIAGRLSARIPELRHASTEDDLPAWIRCVTYHQLSATASDAESQRAFIEEGARAVALKIERLLPDNPLRLDETFAKYTPEQMARYGFQIRNLVRALRPPRVAGRPRKAAHTEPASAGTRSLDHVLSARCYQMSLDDTHWRDIARAMYPTLSAVERGSRTIEKRINRLIERGRLNAKKHGRNN